MYDRLSKRITIIEITIILKNEECATQREKCRGKNLKHKTLKKNFKRISKEMPWTGFEHVPHG